MNKEAKIREWIEKLSILRPELGGFSICPYASSAKYKITECNVDDIEPIEGYDVVIFIVDDYLTPEEVEDWVASYNEIYPEWIFLEDAAEKVSYIGDFPTNNGFFNLILMQNKEKLSKFREKLGNTPYYDYWDEEYMREILGDDYDLVQKQG